MKELPIWKKRAKEKKPRSFDNGRFVEQCQQKHQKIGNDPIDCHGLVRCKLAIMDCASMG
jgi:hypothetical protein